MMGKLIKKFLVYFILVVMVFNAEFTSLSAKESINSNHVLSELVVNKLTSEELVTRTNALDLSGASYKSEAGVIESSLGVYTKTAEGWSFDENTNTLTLSGMTLITDAQSALVASGDFKVILADGTDNIIESNYNGNGRTSTGISAEKLSFYGDTGILNVQGGVSYDSYGIYCDSIDMYGGNVIATGGDVGADNSDSTGVFFSENSTINDGSLKAIAGIPGDDAAALGIKGFFDTKPTLSVLGGELFASAQASNFNQWSAFSLGISGIGRLIVTGGIVKVQSGDALYSTGGILSDEVEISGGNVYSECGINIWQDFASAFSISGNKITIANNMTIRDVDNENALAYLYDDSANSGYITITKTPESGEIVKKVVIREKTSGTISLNDGDSNTLLVSAIQDALLDNDIVTVAGDLSVTDTLYLDIPANKKVNWQAKYTSSANTPAISLSGFGIFEVTSGTIESVSNVIEATNTKIIISGTSRIETTASHGNAIQTDGNIEINDNAQVLAVNGHAIYAIGKTSEVKVSGGIIFANGDAITGLNNVIYLSQNPSGFTGVTNTAVVIAWNKTADASTQVLTTDQITYTQNSDNDLITLPAKIAFWTNKNDASGIYYENGTNIGFLPIENVKVVAATIQPSTPEEETPNTGDELSPVKPTTPKTEIPNTGDKSPLTKHFLLGVCSLGMMIMVFKKRNMLNKRDSNE